MAKELDIAQLEALSPLNGLKRDNLHALLKKIELLEANRGQTLFKKGDTEKRTIYVLSGTIELKEGDGVVQSIAGGTDEARNPISPIFPRHQTAVAADDVKYISIDSELLERTLIWDQTGTYEVGDFTTAQDNKNGDWMTTLLQIKAFQKLPPANIQTRSSLFAAASNISVQTRPTIAFDLSQCNNDCRKMLDEFETDVWPHTGILD